MRFRLILPESRETGTYAPGWILNDAGQKSACGPCFWIQQQGFSISPKPVSG